MSGARRVRITSPQTRIALSRRTWSAQPLLPLPPPGDEGEMGGDLGGGLDDEAARALFARQRRLTIRTMCTLGALLGGLSGLLAALPALDHVTLGGMPASWLLLMTASYPLLLIIAVLHVRGAERNEREYQR